MFKHVFVLGTGRCGTTTFVKACEHFTNYTAEHESRTRLLGTDRLAYPEFHIEADNRLSWLLGRVDETFGDSAFYVHLTRDKHKVAVSYAKRKKGLMEAYMGKGILHGCHEPNKVLVAEDMVDTVTANVNLFLKDKTNCMDFRLENAAEDFATFAQRIGAEGNLEAALHEFSVKHNAS